MTWGKIIISLIACVGLCAFFYWFSSAGYLAIFLNWVKDIGYWGNLLFIIAFTITGLPFMLIGYTPLGLAAGFIYGEDGPILGILNASVTVLIGTILGSILGFWSCRVLCKSWFQRKINENPTLQAFMHTMESKGFYLIVIMRMAPIPFGVQNGLFSVSNVSVLAFSVATIVGLVPEILMLVYMGTTMADLTSIATGDFEFGLWQKIMLGIEIGMTVILFILLFFLSREAMRKVKERQRYAYHSSWFSASPSFSNHSGSFASRWSMPMTGRLMCVSCVFVFVFVYLYVCVLCHRSQANGDGREPGGPGDGGFGDG